MAETRLSDIVEPQKFTDYVALRSLELNGLYQAGIVHSNGEYNKLAMGGGSLVSMPHFNPIGDDDPNVSSDNPANTSTPKKIGAGQQDAIVHYLNQSWSSMDLTMAVAGKDPLMVIGDQVGQYWANVHQRFAIQSVNGLIADNVANDAGDMIHNVATDDVGAPGDAELIGPNQVIRARATLGDAGKLLSTIAMHSVVVSRLAELDAIEYRNTAVAGSTIGMEIPYYKGLRVVVDDGCPAVIGVNRTTYTSYLFGPGAFGYGNGAPKVPHEVKRDPEAGDGGGQETIYSRKNFIMHPTGFSFVKASIAGKSPTMAEAALAANWNRVYDRKRIPMAVLKTNG